MARDDPSREPRKPGVVEPGDGATVRIQRHLGRLHEVLGSEWPGHVDDVDDVAAVDRRLCASPAIGTRRLHRTARGMDELQLCCQRVRVEVAYVVQFSGGSGWQSLDGGTTTTEHWGVPPKAPGVTGTPEFSIGIAQVWDTVNNQGRFVNLANPITIHCPARG